MKRTMRTEAQKRAILDDIETMRSHGVPAVEALEKHDINRSTYHSWRSEYGYTKKKPGRPLGKTVTATELVTLEEPTFNAQRTLLTNIRTQLKSIQDVIYDLERSI